MNITNEYIEIDIYETCGYVSGFLFAFSLVPQIYKSYKTKKMDDISYCWQIIFILGMILMLIYGFHNNLKPVIIPSSIEFTFMVLLLMMKIYYHENEEVNEENIP